MKFLEGMFLLLLLAPLTVAHADVGKVVGPLSCGIYDQKVKPFIEAELETQHADQSRYTMAITTKSGKRLSVEVKSVSIKLVGERNHVSVFLEGKPYAKTSHQDLPLYLEVYVDNEKYRIVCTRADVSPEPERPAGEGKRAAPSAFPRR